MLRRCSLQAAARLAAEAQAGAACTGFGRQWQCSSLAAAPAAAAAGPALLLPHLPPGGLRWHSELAERKPEGASDGVVYVGPFGGAVTRVKKLSLFSCVCALGAGPIILGLDASTTLTAKASIVGTLATFGVFTTGLLNWFTQPYVQRLRYEQDTDTLEATTLTLFARPRVDRFHLREVGEAATVHPLSSFQARGRTYYVDAEHFPDKALLARLVPQAAAAHVMEAANSASSTAAAAGSQQQSQQARQAEQPHQQQ